VTVAIDYDTRDPITGHTVFVHDRGGRRRKHQIKDISTVRWGRTRDDISEAKVFVTAQRSSPQAEALQSFIIGRDEMVIYRGGERVWEGPLTLPKFTRTGVSYGARDVLHYAARTIVRLPYSSAYSDGGPEKVVERVRRMFVAELASREALVPPINVLPHLKDHQTVTDAETTAKTFARQMYLWQELDSRAAKSGIDYTVVGREIHIWDTSQPAMGYVRKAMTEADFDGEVEVTGYGMDLATDATVTDGMGTWGSTNNAADPVLGIWEHLSTAYDEDATEAPTVAELESQAERNYHGRNPTPYTLHIPDNSTINVNGAVRMSDLVPGVYIPIRLQLNVKRFEQVLKLHAVTVEETPDGETIKVTMVPATAADEAEEEE
jgi:hypothetical protein